MKIIAILMSLAALAQGACVAVSSDQIVAGDLSSAFPMLGNLDPKTPVGFAPMPGTRRIFTGHELALIAQRHGLAPGTGSMISNICVERAVRSISPEEMKTALIAALGVPAAVVDLIEFSRQPLPPGRLDFKLAALNKPPPDAPSTPVLWRGRLIYDGQHSANVWAKVSITVDRASFAASESIQSGALIRPEQIQSTTVRQFPFSGPSFDSAGAIAGKIARRSMPAGQSFSPAFLQEPQDVNKGDKVRVQVNDGLASLAFEAMAESSGRKGETILVRNSSSGRNFKAVIQDKGVVSVRSAPGA